MKALVLNSAVFSRGLMSHLKVGMMEVEEGYEAVSTDEVEGSEGLSEVGVGVETEAVIGKPDNVPLVFVLTISI